MTPLPEWRARVCGFLFRRADPSAFDDEVRFHLEMAEEAFRRQGMDPVEARRAAIRSLGGVVRTTEACADQQSLPVLERLVQDTRYGLRALGRAPGFTAAALLTMALGIGANVATFSVVHAVLLRDLPFADSGRLVALSEAGDQPGISTIGYMTIADLRERAGSLEAVVAIRSWNPTLIVNGTAERLDALRVSWNFFQMLGVPPALGRSFDQQEDRPDAWRVLILSDRLWRRSFGADPAVVGRTITMNDLSFQVIGVMPADFEPLISATFYQPAEMWAPLGYGPELSNACRTCRHVRALGRLRTGVTVEAADADLDAIGEQLRAAHPSDYQSGDMRIVKLSDLIAGPVRPLLLVLLGSVALVLLIACANVGNLLLARAMNRTHEMGVRAALGATRGRLVRQMLTESTLLGLAGGAIGVAFAALALRGVERLAPLSIPRMDVIGLNVPVLAFALAISLVTSILFGLLPALGASAHSLQGALAAHTRTQTRSSRARQLLVAADVALALVLLASAGLMLRTVTHLVGTSPGFDPRDVVTAQFALVGQRYRENEPVHAFQTALLERVRGLPGVESAALAGQVPMGGNRDGWGFHIDGRMHANPADAPSAERYSVTPDYFRVMRIPLIRGRGITEADTATSQPVMLVSEHTARTLWGGDDPIGSRVRIGGATGSPWRTVVGIVGDVHHASLTDPPRLEMYLPQSQFTDSFLVLAIRAAVPPDRLAGEIRSALRGLDPAVPMYQLASMESLVEESFADRRFLFEALGAFAIAGMLLAGIGLYGVIAYTVSQRTRELALRLTLGASRRDVLRVVVAAGARSVLAGLVVGLAGAALAARLLDSLLFGVSPADPIAIGVAVALLLLATAAAHVVPAIRALGVNPAAALRGE